jgi:hypothetical protein
MSKEGKKELEVVLPSGEKITLREFAESFPTDAVTSEIDKEILKDLRKAMVEKTKPLKNKSLSDGAVYKRWDEYGLNSGDDDEYTKFKTSHQFEMMGLYLLSLPEGNEDFDIVTTLMFPIIYRVSKANITIDTKELYELTLSKYMENKDNHLEAAKNAYFTIDAEAELIALIAEEIIEEYEQGNSK